MPCNHWMYQHTTKVAFIWICVDFLRSILSLKLFNWGICLKPDQWKPRYWTRISINYRISCFHVMFRSERVYPADGTRWPTSCPPKLNPLCKLKLNNKHFNKFIDNTDDTSSRLSSNITTKNLGRPFRHNFIITGRGFDYKYWHVE